eukprot:764111-Hanusia_phi.AAC.3
MFQLTVAKGDVLEGMGSRLMTTGTHGSKTPPRLVMLGRSWRLSAETSLSSVDQAAVLVLC